MGIPLLQGRDLNDYDLAGAVISHEMAQRYWPNEYPMGRQFRPWSIPNPPVTIVGVAGNVRNFGLEVPPEPVVYLNFAAGVWNPMMLVLRTQSDPRGYANALRTEVRTLDASLPLASIRTMDDLVEQSLAPRRFNMTLLGIFGGVALVLATVGLFGVMAYLVAQRTHEIGLRMALGAQGGDIFRLIVGRGMLLTSIGIVAGIGGALALTHLLTSMLYGSVGVRDPLTFAVTALLLAMVALAACWIPARRAMRVQPVIALRHE
ncbi:MAG: FtsX-like permease family protein, partial [Candidatus Acidiferrales bacterium]